ncbi:hypothetical protein K458DRAFT_420837 [Lentithecium fluviatile CBS 122367]|uniref:Cytochrome b5 heme-binding domain-containing protein n=1 Tax=Lentithecium fluviatile CBS 122367 TaxID=1168545 RepID=A0A6G1ISV9_9PLEO|nr:hypothetical protein K458DRAFT_420837 [Lentithecium fluviatile CBS 122367]
MLVAVSLIAISLSFLFYKHPPSTWSSYAPAPNKATVGGDSETPQSGGADERVHAEELRKQTDRETSSLSTSSSPQTTPKVLPNDTANGSAIPTLTLAEHASSDEEEDDNLPPPSFPAMNSAQRASAQPTFSGMAPPPKPTVTAPPPKPPSLMPPPRINPSNLRALPTPSQSMHVPTTGPLPNRGPVPNRGPPAFSGGLAPMVKTPNARGKVLLSPGHSPLDWANLQRSGKNLSGVSSLIRVTPSMLKENNGRKGKPAWSNYQGKVYNITPYLPFHPGGEGELRRAAGKDGGKLFMEVHPWVNWDNMLGECIVGVMVAEEQASGTSSLEDMD